MIQLSIAAVGKIDPSKVLILSTPLGYQGKRDVLFSLLENMRVDPTNKQHIKGFLNAADQYLGLRNAIAHSTWRGGTRPDSVKPIEIKVRGGTGRLIGMSDAERDYTYGELVEIHDRLVVITNSYVDFLRKAGYLSAIDAKMLQTRS